MENQIKIVVISYKNNKDLNNVFLLVKEMDLLFLMDNVLQIVHYIYYNNPIKIQNVLN